ncbi:hypothetical protein A7K72_02660 [Candidatus Methylacidiphilum fumarolicum]|nr:hypothetical protein A7K72_02660 [Candidatus Methylacidiphilum fumarolicum]
MFLGFCPSFPAADLRTNPCQGDVHPLLNLLVDILERPLPNLVLQPVRTGIVFCHKLVPFPSFAQAFREAVQAKERGEKPLFFGCGAKAEIL